VLSIAAGLVVAGIAGGLLAVPLLAVVNAGVRSLLHDPALAPETVHALVRSEAEATGENEPPAGDSWPSGGSLEEKIEHKLGDLTDTGDAKADSGNNDPAADRGKPGKDDAEDS
jgi:hypothetical protein